MSDDGGGGGGGDDGGGGGDSGGGDYSCDTGASNDYSCDAQADNNYSSSAQADNNDYAGIGSALSAISSAVGAVEQTESVKDAVEDSGRHSPTTIVQGFDNSTRSIEGDTYVDPYYYSDTSTPLRGYGTGRRFQRIFNTPNKGEGSERQSTESSKFTICAGVTVMIVVVILVFKLAFMSS